jgi:signal transduction histidine kinase
MADARFALGPRLAMLAVAAAALAWAVTAIVAIDPAAERPTTYAASLAGARVADIAAGLGLVLAGWLAMTTTHARRVGLLAILVGLAWLGADWEGWADGPSLLRSLGAAATPFSLALVLHLVLAFPDGRLRSRSAYAAAVAAYGIATVVSIGRALFRDPLLDLYCWRNCRDNAFLVHADPGIARTLDDIWLWSALVIGLGLLAFGGGRLLGASRPARRVLAPVLGPAMLVGASEATYAVALMRTPLEDPSRAGFAAIFLARSLSFTAVALGIAGMIVRVIRTRTRVARLATELGEAPPPGKLSEALRVAVGDPRIDVAYCRRDSGELVDAGGRPKELPLVGRDTAVARIARGDRALALVVHDPALVDEQELERQLGSAARLAVENEALRAEALAQVRELRASRARIVETGDAERRRLERNLHDGAQQRLLALAYDLRLARASANTDSDAELVAVLEAAGGETATALDQLRELAHGIYPAILGEAGLAPALATLADEAPLPIELGDVTLARRPAAVEMATYVTIAESIDDAARRGATFLSARVRHDGDRLVVMLEDDGARRGSSLVHLADRIGALGGSFEVGDTTLRAEIPCE